MASQFHPQLHGNKGDEMVDKTLPTAVLIFETWGKYFCNVHDAVRVKHMLPYRFAGFAGDHLFIICIW